MAGACIMHGEQRNVYQTLVGKPEGNRTLGRPRRRWVISIKRKLAFTENFSGPGNTGWKLMQHRVSGFWEYVDEPLNSTAESFRWVSARTPAVSPYWLVPLSYSLSPCKFRENDFIRAMIPFIPHSWQIFIPSHSEVWRDIPTKCVV
jgi:hypothetical protein